MVMLRLKRLAGKPRNQPSLRSSVCNEVSSMERANALEAYVKARRKACSL